MFLCRLMDRTFSAVLNQRDRSVLFTHSYHCCLTHTITPYRTFHTNMSFCKTALLSTSQQKRNFSIQILEVLFPSCTSLVLDSIFVILSVKPTAHFSEHQLQNQSKTSGVRITSLKVYQVSFDLVSMTLRWVLVAQW